MDRVAFKFIGMNNMDDPTDLDITKGECVDLCNVDADNGGGAALRNHRTAALPTQDSVTVEGFTFTATSELILGTTVKNTTDVYEHGQYDAPFDGGIAVEFFGGRVYRAGLMDGVSVVAYSKPGEFRTQDVRNNVAMMSGSRITMLGRVDNGLFVGTDSEVLFLGGSDPVEGGFSFMQVLPFGVIENTCVRTVGSKVSAAGMQGSVIIFASYQGVVVGGNGGQVANLSDKKVSYAHGTRGSAILREEGGLIHYVFAPDYGATAFNQYVQTTIDVDSI